MKIENQTKKSIYSNITKRIPSLENFLRVNFKKIRELDFQKNAKKIINEIYQKEYCKLFNHVQIETISKCNGKCSFCPVNIYTDPRKTEWMEKETFFKIINELKEINYNGVISFFGNNEPFLDNRLIGWIEDSRELLPNAVFSLYTNGTPLTLNKYLRISSILDELVINNYNDLGELNPNTSEIVKHTKNSNNSYNNVTIRLRLENQVMDTRSGNSPNKLKNIKIKSTCSYPFHQINILPNGNISLCCNDAYGEQVMGNMKKNKLTEIWQNENYKEIRKKIYDTRQNVKICQSCDEIKNAEDYLNKKILIDKKKNEMKGN